MTEIKYTSSQYQAVSLKNQNIMVSAAAGSGKTRVLVDRILTLIHEEQVPLRKMLVVTFTNAAAGEMKDRLSQGLQAAIVAESDIKKIRFLRQQFQELPVANVSTMHAFCSVMLRKYYQYLDIQPNFSILTTQTANKLRDKALDTVLEKTYKEEDKSHLDLVSCYGGAYSDDGVKYLIASLNRIAAAQPYPLNWLQNIKNEADLPLKKSVESYFRQLVCDLAEQMKDTLTKMEALLDKTKKLQSYHKSLDQDKLIAKQIELNLNQSLDEIFSMVKSITWSRLGSISKDISDNDESIKKQYQLLREQGLKAPLNTLKGLIPHGGMAQINRDAQVTAPRIKALCDLTKKTMEEYGRIKAKRNALDFLDLEQEMLKLLSISEVKANIQAEIEYLFFDEYQDANLIQEAIVNAIANPNALFFVGDVKQAIYRFRQADPSLFNQRYRLYDQQTSEGTLIHLSENFRSRQEILRFNNQIFELLMTERLGEVNYCSPGQALVCGAEHPPDSEAVQMAIIDSKNHKAQRHFAEGLWIAKEIRNLVKTGVKKYSDIVILFRVPSTHIADYEKALEYEGIPYYTENSIVQFNNMEVQLFLNLLRVIDNDSLDEPLIAVLTSPFGRFTEHELAEIRLSQPHGRFSSAFKAYADENDELAKRIHKFNNQLEKWRLRSKMLSLPDFSEELLQESGFAIFIESLNCGHERIENVRSLIELMISFEAEEFGSLYKFLKHVDLLEQSSGEGIQPAIALDDTNNCVRLMSIHKSKGLGFDTVFLADLNHRFNYKDSYAALVSHSELGIGIDAIYLESSVKRASFNKKLIAHRLRQDTKSEEVRLLYVAMTRAIDRLYLVGSGDRLNGSSEKSNMAAIKDQLVEANSFLSWFDIILNHVDFEKEIFSLKEVSAEDLINDKMNNLTSQNDISLPWDPKQVDHINKKLNIKYPHILETEEAYKKTVSELSKENRIIDSIVGPWPAHNIDISSAEPEIKRPAFLTQALHFTAREQGVILHRVMQLIPLIDYQSESEIKDALKLLVKKGLLSSAECNAIDCRLILGFFNSPLGQRILDHKEKVEREKAFTMFYGNYLVDGQIDLLFSDEEGYHIVDFKSDRQIKPERYRTQMKLYQEAVMGAKQISRCDVTLYWLRHQKSTRL